MSVKMLLKCHLYIYIYIYSMSGYMFRAHRAIFGQHILMESTAPCLLLSMVLVQYSIVDSQLTAGLLKPP
jgi:hypothetical protein